MIGRALRRRRMLRQLRQLDRIEANFGLGTTPTPRRATGERTRSGLVLVVSLLVVAGVLIGPGDALPNSWARRLGLSDGPLGQAPQAPSSSSYTFLKKQVGSNDPVAWDPCRPIRYAVNPAGGPDGAVSMTRDSIAEVARLTGLRFDYVGQTDDRPRWGARRTWLPRRTSYDVLVSWATSSEVPQLAASVAGIGGAQAQGLRGGVMRYVSGGATLDRDSFDTLDHRPDGRLLQRAIVLHELGHVVGLGHVHDPRQLMYADNVGQGDFADGDKAGLARVGSGTCF